MTTPSSARKGSLFVIFLTVCVDLLGFGIVLPLAPLYAKEFGGDTSGWKVGLFMCSFSAMQFLFSPLWGKLSDRIGRRPVLMVGLLGSTIFYALFGYATSLGSFTLLFASRIGAGIMGATISTAQAYIADCTTVENRAKGMALIGAAFGIGFTFGPILGAMALKLSAVNAVENPWPGYIAAGLSGVALLLAIVKLPESLAPDSQSAERHGWSLSAWQDALQTPTLGALLLVMFISVTAFGGFETTLSLALKERLSYAPENLVYVFAYIGLVLSLVQGGIVRRLSGKVSEVRLATIGGVLTIAGFLGLIWVMQTLSAPLLFVATAIEVAGFSFMTPSLNSLISRRSDPAKQGSVLGVSQSVSALARIAGPLLAIPTFTYSPALLYLSASGLMLLGLGALALAARGGKDFSAAREA